MTHRIYWANPDPICLGCEVLSSRATGRLVRAYPVHDVAYAYYLDGLMTWTEFVTVVGAHRVETV